MPAEPTTLRSLVARVGAFHLTDRPMLAAQRAMEAALAQGEPSAADVRIYVAAVSRYFDGFEREARAHLRDLDRRIEHANQVVFNLTAERGVAAKRIEVTANVLALVAQTLEVPAG